MSTYYENLVSFILLRPWTHYSTYVDVANTTIM
jgi:hypothetical protein